MKPSHKKLVRFMEAKGLKQAGLARLLECTPAFASMLCHGNKEPGRRLANIIEQKTADWSEGPIRSEDWDLEEAAEVRKVARKKRAA